MPKPKSEEPKLGAYEWGENHLKLERSKKYVADLEANKQVSYATPEEREEAVKERYLELAGHIKGTKMVRPRRPGSTFGGVSTVDEEDDDDE